MERLYTGKHVGVVLYARPIYKESQKCVSIWQIDVFFDEHVHADDESLLGGDCTVAQPFPKKFQVSLHSLKRVMRRKRTR